MSVNCLSTRFPFCVCVWGLFLSYCKVFFISDESPVNQFDFLRPLCVGLGYTPPSLHLSLSLMLFIALLAELFFALFSKCFTFAPFLSRAEVYQVRFVHSLRVVFSRLTECVLLFPLFHRSIPAL